MRRMDLLNNNGNDKNNKKKSQGFTILSGDSTGGHGGFGVGSLSLDSMSPVIVDTEGGEAFVDMGALHARSAIEKRIKFLPNKEDVPNGKPYWIVWVTIERTPEGSYYAGATACEVTVDEEIRRGYKNLAEHVNKMDKSLKRKVMVDHMDDKSKKILRDYLKGFDEGMWQRSTDELKTGLGVE
jgi:hypothetical protein